MKTQKTSYSPPNPYSLGCLTRLQQLDWHLVVSCLHYSGEQHKTTPNDVHNRAWTLADGFGRRTLKEIHEELEWDWSHVRDSSEEATQKIAAYLRRSGFDLPEQEYRRALAG
jgi:hypothetical protein